LSTTVSQVVLHADNKARRFITAFTRAWLLTSLLSQINAISILKTKLRYILILSLHYTRASQVVASLQGYDACYTLTQFQLS
jgi:hypothetical protein